MKAIIITLVATVIGIKLINLLFTTYDVVVANGHVENNFEVITRLVSLLIWCLVLYGITRGHIKIPTGRKSSPH